ncbi:MAG TPA: hypothetical protein P5556_07545 [Candidatus Gastranaerophilales bacterium]|nr:hypothetical protein [Candidatus Gastranaerophilales bacterium]
MVNVDLSQKKKQVSKNQNRVIQGKFSEQNSAYKKPVIIKINVILAFALLLSVVLCMVSYLGVIAKESKIKELHISTNKINYENIELQNKVDYLKSFYNVDDKVQKIDFLKKADQVMEVKERNEIPVLAKNKSVFNAPSVPGY